MSKDPLHPRETGRARCHAQKVPFERTNVASFYYHRLYSF